MSDTWRLNAIVLAILIIADKKIAQAGYDKTRKGVISLVIDKTSGKYRVKYQDSLFLAYATSSNVYYEVGQLVSFLVPGNDWSREITIINGVKNYATNYTEVPEASLLYNKTGPSAVKSEGVFGLCSYKIEEKSLIKEGFLNIDQLIGKTYIPQGNGLVIGMDVQTSLDSSQVNGNYGLRFDLVFRNILTGSLNDELDFSQGGAAVRSYFVTDRDVIGNPYGLTKTTTVEHLLNIDDINPADFVKIKDIVAYCNDFPQGQDGKLYLNDIFFSNIHINGVKVLSDLDLNGYVVHIDYSETGQIIEKIPLVLEGELPKIITVKLLASLKVNGKKVTSEDLLSYYWFRLNGLIFRNSDTYSSYGGDGWECLNNFANGKPVPATNTIYFTSSAERQDVPLTIPSNEYNTRVKCVIVYKYKETSGFLNVINKNIRNFYIDNNLKQSGNNTNKVDYYLDYGMPNLTCLPLGYKLGDDLSNYTFTWSVVPARGQAVQILETDDTDYKRIKNLYLTAQKLIEKVPLADLDNYKTATGYQAKVNEYDRIKNISYVNKNIYYNFPISSIINYSKIICSVHEGDTYKGSASITLYNHTQVPDTYSLNIENSTQVFQYDGKGNSPTSPQLEKPLLIKPLSFTLIDDEGNQVSYLQIINNGYVEWIIPTLNTLLISDDEKNGSPLDDALLIGTDKALAASLGYKVSIYKRPSKEDGQTGNLSSFVYKIADTYDSKKVNNNIRLDVKYKDMLFTAYTDFTFPKDGNPGTNGTDYVVKLTPSTRTDRVYISNKKPKVLFDDNGSKVDKLNFLLYNNSRKVEGAEPSLWTCPPKGTSNDKDKGNTYISVNNGLIKAEELILDTVLTDKPIDIVRVLYKNGDLNQYAEYPICYNYFVNSNNYRFKIKPKTGFKYAVYQLDGTSPLYDNTLPFEVIVLVFEGSRLNTYFIAHNWNEFKYDWDSIGLIEKDEKRNTQEKNILKENQKYFKPKNSFNGSDLTSAIVIKIYQKDENEAEEKGDYIGYLHVPIYMIINRYGHSALNNWDGNSIQLNANGDTILAPQVGAGSKNNQNQFTGVLMGSVKLGDATKQGLFGYDEGQRSIFLDAETGNALFGKDKDARINIGADTVGIAPRGSIYSGNYYKYDTNGKPNTLNNQGMLIDLITPLIKFGSGNFSVNSAGLLTAKGGGSIAGWTISDNTLYKAYVGMNSNPNNSSYNSNIAPNDTSLFTNSTNGNMAFWAGSGTGNEGKNFYVTHNGYLYSKSGKIAKWSINENTLTDDNVGMGTNPNTINFTYNVGGVQQTAAITDSRIWSGNKFVVTDSGKLYTKDGQIGPWTIGDTSLTNGYVGLGYNIIDKSRFSTSNNITARIWSGADGSLDFVVTNDGALYSRSGKIGGWNIESNKLWSVNKDSGAGKAGIRLNADGSMSGGKGYNSSDGTSGSWSIATNGRATFSGIKASYADIDHATIDTATVTNGYISTGYFGTSGSKITIDNSGIHGTGFDITPTYTHFDGLKVDSEGISTSSGGTISGGGSNGGFSLSGTGGSVGGCAFGGSSSTGHLAVDTLLVGGKKVTWSDLTYVTGATLKYKKLKDPETFYWLSNTGVDVGTDTYTILGSNFTDSTGKPCGGSVTITIPTGSGSIPNKNVFKGTHAVTQITSLKLTAKTTKVLGAKDADNINGLIEEL